MPKKAVSLTLDDTNLLWLKGRANVLAGGSLSAAVDQLVDEARAGTLGAATPPRSVVGTIDLPDEAALVAAGEAIQGLFTGSLKRALVLHEPRPARPSAKPSRKK
jgi:hypothetical protein